MEIIFSKLHGQGNDFILINNLENSLSLSKEEIIHLCGRHFGIGADGLILVGDSKIGDFKMDYFNQDGSRAEMCGNGIRCMAKFIYEKNISRKANLSIETLAGIKNIYMNISNGFVGNIKVNMGQPVFTPKKIPVKIEGMKEVFNYNLKIDSKTFRVNLVSMGNPHCIIFLEEEDLENFDFKKWGAVLEKHPIFPQKTNVEFVKVNSKKEITMKVWERGVGETLACGTGACASAVAALKKGRISGNAVLVNLPGGRLVITWENDVYLEGKVNSVFDGKYFLNK